jgi:hypothetical protein
MGSHEKLAQYYAARCFPDLIPKEFLDDCYLSLLRLGANPPPPGTGNKPKPLTRRQKFTKWRKGKRLSAADKLFRVISGRHPEDVYGSEWDLCTSSCFSTSLSSTCSSGLVC